MKKLFRRGGRMRCIAAAAAPALLLPAVFFFALFWSPRPDLYGGADFSRVCVDREGRVLRVCLTRDEKYRIFTPLDAMSAELREATLLYEDRAFWSHSGVSLPALVRAAWSTLSGERRMGASTLTMQVARMTGDIDSSRIPGKLRQIWRALVLERHYSKREILEAYLNLAPYGGNIEGAGAAARIYFSKEAAALSLPEVMALALVPQHPAARSPLSGRKEELDAARRRLHALWSEAHPGAGGRLFAESPLRVRGPRDLPSEAPHAVDSLLNGPDAVPTEAADGRNGVIVTTLDLNIQHMVEDALRRGVERGGRWGMRNAAALLVDWRTAEIRALAGSADFGNAAISGQVDGTSARRSPGSALKPFVYALALEQGLIHPATILADTPRVFRGYEPENADGAFRGPLRADEALRASRNIPAIWLAERLRAPGLHGFLRDAGVRFEHGADHYGLALVLGGAETTMRELAGLYAMLPGLGRWRKPSLLPASDGSGGRDLLSPEAAWVTLGMLRQPWLSGLGGAGFGDIPCAWKTGTSSGLRDAWTAGVFGPYVLVVWVGNFDNSSNPGFTGLHAAAPLFFDIARGLVRREGLRDIALSPSYAEKNGLNVRRVQVCAPTGDVRLALCGERPRASCWFIPGVSPIRDSGILREIVVDTRSGLRQCRDIPGVTERQVWEFWPADMRELFRRAGVRKAAPPPFAPECGAGGAPGRPPAIVSPRAGVAYARRVKENLSIPLIARADEDAEKLFWFDGREFLGADGTGGELTWNPSPGRHVLRVVDNLGRTAELAVEVESVP